MWWYHGNWGWDAWLIITLGMVAFWGLVIWTVATLVRNAADGTQTYASHTQRFITKSGSTAKADGSSEHDDVLAGRR